MAYNAESFILKEGFWSYGTVATPTAVPTMAGDPLVTYGWVKTDDGGWFKMGTLALNDERTYATFKAGTPSVKVRIDIIEAAWTIVSQNAQFDMDSLEKWWNRPRITGAYGDLLQYGSDMPPLTGRAILWESQLVGPSGAARQIRALMFNGLMTLENASIALSGTEHGTYPFKAEATPHPNFTNPLEPTQAVRSYGSLWQIN